MRHPSELHDDDKTTVWDILMPFIVFGLLIAMASTFCANIG